MFKKLIMLAFALALAACGNSVGSSYLGKWVRVDNAAATLVITKNGDNYLIEDVEPNPLTKQPSTAKVSAVLKDGILEMQTAFGAAGLTYIKATDTLTFPGGDESNEYKRIK